MPEATYADPAQICALYKQGLSEVAVARRLGVWPTLVHETLVLCNVERRVTGVRSPAAKQDLELRLARAAAMYMSGKTYQEIGDKTKIDTKRCKAAVIRFGGTPRLNRKLSEAEKAEKVERAKERAERRAAKHAAQREHEGDGDSTEVLRAMYEDEKLTPQAIAEKLGVNRSTVVRRLVRAGIQRRNCSEVRRMRDPRVDINRLKRLYLVERLTIRQVAADLGVSYGRVQGLLKSLGITAGERHIDTQQYAVGGEVLSA